MFAALFADHSKETAQLEAKAFELEQSTALASEAKSVLDSWVRYEGQVKVRQQKELSDTIMAKIQKELESPKVLQQILQQSVADVESKQLLRVSDSSCTNYVYRDYFIKGTIDGKRDPEHHRFLLSSPLLSINYPCAIAQSISCSNLDPKLFKRFYSYDVISNYRWMSLEHQI